MMEICSRTLDRILGSVISGSDACLFSYGHARLGKTYTMLGVDDRPDLLGIIPCSIAWLFRMLDDLKKNSGFRYSVRVSALEVTGKQEEIKDLLSESFASAETPHSTTCSDPLDAMGGYRAPTPEHAALFLDAAIAARTISNDRNSHFLYTIHLHQQRFDGTHESSSSHSRLHLLDLGSCQKHKDSVTSMSLSELGNIFFSLLNGKKFIPQSDSKLTQLLKKIFSSYPNIEACMVAHVSPTVKSYHQTLQILHLASQIQRSTLKRRSKNCTSTSSNDSFDSPTKNSDIDYSSSSEQSVDTVIFVAKKPSDPIPPPNITIPPRAKIYPKNLSNLKKPNHSHNNDIDQQAKVHKHMAVKNTDEVKSTPIIERCQPQGREVNHHYHENSKPIGAEDEKRIDPEQLRERSTYKESNGELWIDGPAKGAVLSEQWIDGPHEFWTTPCAGIHGLKSPKIKKLYSALKQKHQQMHLESCQKSTRCTVSTNDTEIDKQEKQQQKQQQQSQSLQTLQDEKYFVTASPDITAFHNFFEKHKQDLIHQKYSLPSESKLNNVEDFNLDNCCCKCHMKNGECKTAQSKSPKQTNPSKENKHPKLKVERNKDLNECVQDDRIADWVSSVQESGFSKFTQLLHSRKELLKSFQSPKNRHNMKPVLMEYFQNASPLATFDSPLVDAECNSPPPDYDSCMANNNLDINENQMTSLNSQTLPPVNASEETRTKDEFHARKKTSAKPQVLVSNSKLCNGSAVQTKTFPDSARKLGPDGASCHSLSEESLTLDHCSIHESLRKNRSKKTQLAGRNNLKSSRNYSSSETIFIPSFENDKIYDHNDILSPNTLIHVQSTSKNLTSPKKERCSLAMALLSCAAKYRKRSENVHSKSKPHPTTSASCLKQLSGRLDNGDVTDAEFPEQKNITKRNLLVIHNLEGSGPKSYKSIVQPPTSLKVNAPSRTPR